MFRKLVLPISVGSLVSMLAVFAFTRCDPMPPDQDFKPERREHLTREWKDYPVARYHDDQANVTCWVIATAGISCLPDRDVGGRAAPTPSQIPNVITHDAGP